MQFKLRPWSMNDLESLVQNANNPAIAKNMMDQFPYPYTTEAGIKFIEFATKDQPIHIFAIEIEGKAVGGIGLHLQEDVRKKNAELGYWLAEPYWGKGIITKAISEMVEFGFKNFDIDRIFARPYGTNKGSQRVLEKAGFILEARFDKTCYKNNEYQDELVYATRKQ